MESVMENKAGKALVVGAGNNRLSSENDVGVWRK
jgi:hypothetical protein